MRNILVIAVLLINLSSYAANVPPALLLISIDGLRPKDLSPEIAPHITQLAKEGTQAKYLRPIFPSLTFPNHYTLVTGQYAENHGITGNEIKDPDIAERFSLGAPREVTNDPRWWIGEPIWVTAQKQGLRSGTLFWPGSEAKIQGILPTYSIPYDINLNNQARVDKLLTWFDLDQNQRPHFYTLYFDTVDTAGHRYGPGSPEVLEALKEVDEKLGYLFSELKKRDLYENTHILLVSDHGMAELDEAKHIDVSDVLSEFKDIEKVGSTAVVGIFSKNPQQIGKIESALKRKSNLYKVYRKNKIPSRFHYQKSKRIPDLLLVAQEGASISARISFAPRSGYKGAHGYDNTLNSMQAVFIARGPNILKNKRINGFNNIHLYEIMCRLLEIKPAPNDGSLKSVPQFLR